MKTRLRVGEHKAPPRQRDAVEGLHERRVQRHLRGQHAHVLDVIVHGAVGAAAHNVRRVCPFDLAARG